MRTGTSLQHRSDEALSLSKDALVVLRCLDQTSFAMNRQTRSRILLTATEAALLKALCDDSVAAGISKLMRSRLPQFTSRLLQAGIIVPADSDCASSDPHLFSMSTTVERFFVELTSACDLRCRHCFGRFGPTTRRDIPMKMIKWLLREGRELGVHRMDLTGGEPTMHPFFDEVVAEIRNAGFVLTIFSNLTHLSAKNLAALASYPPLHVTTSIESLQTHVHDEFRGQKGSLRRTLANIEKLRNLSIPVQVNLVVGTHNYDDVPQTLDWLRSQDLPVIVDTVRLEGRATRDLLLSQRQARRLASLIAEETSSLATPKPSLCGIANSMVFVSSSGKLRICPSLNSSKHELADLNSAVFTEESTLRQPLQSLVLYYDEFGHRPCRQTCPVSDRCDGGCPASALSITGSAVSPDPHMCMRFEEIPPPPAAANLLVIKPKEQLANDC